MNTIYLVGQISPKFSETYEWRQRVKDEFSENPNFKIINPCHNNFNRTILQQKKYAISKESVVPGINILVPKDLSYVLESNIAIVNLNHYDIHKPIIGSCFELAWYTIHPEKTVIAFHKDLNSYICKHPFINNSVTTWCQDEYEACELIKYYF